MTASLLTSPGHLSTLAVLNNVVVWMVSTRPPTSKSSSSFSNPLVPIPNAPITIVICMFHIFFQFPSKVEVLILFFTFFQIYSVVSRDSKIDNFASSLFLLIILRSGLLAGIRWSVCISKSHRSLCVLLSLFTSEFCTSVLADGFSQEFEWQQVSSNIQDSSQYYYYYHYYYYSTLLRVFH